MTSLVAEIEALMAERALEPGDRLPPERMLASELGVSRSRLREAIQQLVSRGVVVSRQGGGTFVAAREGQPMMQALAPLSGLARIDAGYWRDVMEIRKSLDADAAWYAARRAGESDRARLRAALEAVSATANASAAVQAEADAAFHLAIAEAAHNAVLRQLVAGLFGLMRTSIAESLRQLFRLPGAPERLEAQHRRIAEAILAGEADAARAAVLEHLAFVEESLSGIEEEAARSRRAALARNTVFSQEEAKP